MAARIILGIANPALDANGEVDSGATLTFYDNLTTTLKAIYSDTGLTTPLTNPLHCDAAGRFPTIWSDVGSTYSVKWSPTGEAPITYDNISTTGSTDGSWTPGDASGAGLSLSSISAHYTRLGNLMFAYASFQYPVNANAALAKIGGLPTPAPAALYAGQGVLSYCTASSVTSIFPNSGQSSASFWNASGVQVANSVLSGATVHILLIYPVS